MKVILIVEVEGLEDKSIFEKHLKKEGFTPVENEEFAYDGDTTHIFLAHEHLSMKSLKKV